jgi:RNA polymerase sigma-70 factor (ECF subfamily)
LVSSFIGTYRGADPPAHVRERLEAALHDIGERGQSAWPDVALDVAVLAAYLGERAPPEAELAPWLDEIRARDIFLACACALGTPRAIRAFDTAFLERLSFHLRSLRPTPELVAETKQELLVSLFVGAPGSAPKIRQYGGRGTLDRWVCVTAVRTALDLLRRQKKHHRYDEGGRHELDEHEVADAVATGRDPDLQLLRMSHEDDFVAALREAMSSLAPRERALLRFMFVDGLTPARIGVVYGIHRTTAMRWVDAAQEAVLAGTRSRLMERLRLSPSECDGIVALLRSQVHVTLGSLLMTPSC